MNLLQIKIQSKINYHIDILNNHDQPLCILYKCIQKNVNFDINNCKPFLNGKTNIKDITQIYYDTYTNLGIKNL